MQVSETVVEVRFVLFPSYYSPLFTHASPTMHCFPSINLLITVISSHFLITKLCKVLHSHLSGSTSIYFKDMIFLNIPSKLRTLHSRTSTMYVLILALIVARLTSCQLISRVLCGVSTSLRFPGQLNGWASINKYEVYAYIFDQRPTKALHELDTVSSSTPWIPLSRLISEIRAFSSFTLSCPAMHLSKTRGLQLMTVMWYPN